MKLKRENFKKWKKSQKNSFGSISLLRPLLETTRFDLKKLCQIWGLPIYPDATNQNLGPTRNRIRMQLLPILRFFFNPQIDTIFAQFVQINLQEQDYLDYLATRLIKDICSKKRVLQNKSLNRLRNIRYQQYQQNVSFGNDVLYKFEFQNQPFFFIPLAIQKRISKKLIESFLNKKVNFFHVEHLMKYLKNSQNLV